MLAKVLSFGLNGIEGYKVTVEVDISMGLPKFDIVGLGDTAIKEAKERVKSAIRNSGLKYPVSAITCNLAPADIKKEGTYYDLSIAVAILSASGVIDYKKIGDTIFLGELSLNGDIKKVTGLLPLLIAAKEKISTPMTVLNKELTPDKIKEIKPVKAAIAVSCLVIPLAEYALCYLKNLFTLKMFHQADFNNIANLNKDKTEHKEKQEKVKKSAINHMLGAAAAFGGCLLTSLLLVKKGKNSDALQKLSDLILTPGSVFFKNNEKKAATVNKYFSLDFRDDKGKLSLSHGQLTACVLLGGAGYFGSSADRGKQNFLETLFRFPLVGFYVVTGSEMFERGFKKILKKRENFKDTISDDLKVPSYKDLPELAQKLAAKNKTTVEAEFQKLCKLIIRIQKLLGIRVFLYKFFNTFWISSKKRDSIAHQAFMLNFKHIFWILISLFHSKIVHIFIRKCVAITHFLCKFQINLPRGLCISNRFYYFLTHLIARIFSIICQKLLISLQISRFWQYNICILCGI